MSSKQCPSCGAPIEITNRFAKVLVCQYCDTHSTIQDDGLDAIGKFAKMADFPSYLSLNDTGTLLGKPFKAVGRIRYKYDGGHYDEWFLDYDGGNAWLTEDEGTLALFTDLYEEVDMDEAREARAGQIIMVGDKKVMVKERGDAEVEGCEGELFFYEEPGTEITYIDGVSDGKKVSIEFSDDEIEFFIGRPLMKRDVQIEGR